MLTSTLMEGISEELIAEVLAIMPEIDCFELRIQLQQLEDELKNSQIGFQNLEILTKFEVSKEKVQPLGCLEFARNLLVEIRQFELNNREILQALEKLLGPQSKSRDGSPNQSPRVLPSPRLGHSADSLGMRISQDRTPNVSPRPNDSPKDSPRVDSPRPLAVSALFRNPSGSLRGTLNLSRLESLPRETNPTGALLPAFRNSQVTPRGQVSYAFPEGKRYGLNTVLQLEGLIKQLYLTQARLSTRHLSEILSKANTVFVLFKVMNDFNEEFMKVHHMENQATKVAENLEIILSWWGSLIRWLNVYNQFETIVSQKTVFEEEFFVEITKKISNELRLLGREQYEFLSKINCFFTTKKSDASNPRLFLEHFLKEVLGRIADKETEYYLGFKKNINVILGCEPLNKLLDSLIHFKDFNRKNPNAEGAFHELEKYLKNHYLFTSKNYKALEKLTTDCAGFYASYKQFYRSKMLIKIHRSMFDYKPLILMFGQLKKLINGFNEYCEASGKSLPFKPQVFARLNEVLTTIKSRIESQNVVVDRKGEAKFRSEEAFAAEINGFFSMANDHRKKPSSHLIEHVLTELASLSFDMDLQKEISLLTGEQGALRILIEAVITYEQSQPNGKIAAMNTFERTLNKERFDVENEAELLEDPVLLNTCKMIREFVVVPEFSVFHELVQSINQSILDSHVFQLVNYAKRKFENSLDILRRLSGSAFMFLSIIRDKGQYFRVLHQEIEQSFKKTDILATPFLEFHQSVDDLVMQEAVKQVRMAMQSIVDNPEKTLELEKIDALQAGLETSQHQEFYFKNVRAVLERKYDVPLQQIARKLNVLPEHLLFANGKVNVGGWSVDYLVKELGSNLNPVELEELSKQLKIELQKTSDFTLVTESCYGIAEEGQRSNGISVEIKKDLNKFIPQLISVRISEEVNRFVDLCYIYAVEAKRQASLLGRQLGFVEFIQSGCFNKDRGKGSSSLKGQELALKVKFLDDALATELDGIFNRIIIPKLEGLVLANLLLEILGKLNYCVATTARYARMPCDIINGTLLTLLGEYQAPVKQLTQDILLVLQYLKENPKLGIESNLLVKLQELGKIFFLEVSLLNTPVEEYIAVPLTARYHNDERSKTAVEAKSPHFGLAMRKSSGSSE